MQLEMQTAPFVAAYLARCDGIVVPVGSTEQHGPTGLIGTDHLCAQAIARRFGVAQGVLVAPTIAVGQSHFHLGFAGTLALRPSTLMAVMQDYIGSLAATGFRHIYVLNGHGGNVAPIRSAVAEFYANRSFAGTGTGTSTGDVHVRLRSWWELPGVNALRQELYGAQEGFHATPSEIAITLAAYPDAIAHTELPAPAPAADQLDHGGDNYLDAADYRRRFPDGRVVSHSALGTRADGERLWAAASEDLAADFTRFMTAA